MIFDENPILTPEGDDDAAAHPPAGPAHVELPLFLPDNPIVAPPLGPTVLSDKLAEAAADDAPLAPILPLVRATCTQVPTAARLASCETMDRANAHLAKLRDAKEARLAVRVALPESVVKESASVGSEHVIGNDFVGLICDEVALLALRSVHTQNPLSPSYDLALPPKTYEEALLWPDKEAWLGVMHAELNTMTSMGVYKVVEAPVGQKAIGCRCVFEFKIVEGSPVYNACLVTQGFSQVPGMDYGKTFTPVCHTSSVCLLAAVTARLGWSLVCFNATSLSCGASWRKRFI